jgi:hypothetical protein
MAKATSRIVGTQLGTALFERGAIPDGWSCLSSRLDISARGVPTLTCEFVLTRDILAKWRDACADVVATMDREDADREVLLERDRLDKEFPDGQ